MEHADVLIPLSSFLALAHVAPLALSTTPYFKTVYPLALETAELSMGNVPVTKELMKLVPNAELVPKAQLTLTYQKAVPPSSLADSIKSSPTEHAHVTVRM